MYSQEKGGFYVTRVNVALRAQQVRLAAGMSRAMTTLLQLGVVEGWQSLTQVNTGFRARGVG
jgi:hypothetical protein